MDTTTRLSINGVPVKAIEQYHKLRMERNASMMDSREVMEYAHIRDWYYLEDWLAERGPVGYVQLLTAYTSWRRDR